MRTCCQDGPSEPKSNETEKAVLRQCGERGMTISVRPKFLRTSRAVSAPKKRHSTRNPAETFQAWNDLGLDTQIR
jgi:hypothetical protein